MQQKKNNDPTEVLREKLDSKYWNSLKPEPLTKPNDILSRKLNYIETPHQLFSYCYHLSQNPKEENAIIDLASSSTQSNNIEMIYTILFFRYLNKDIFLNTTPWDKAILLYSYLQENEKFKDYVSFLLEGNYTGNKDFISFLHTVHKNFSYAEKHTSKLTGEYENTRFFFNHMEYCTDLRHKPNNKNNGALMSQMVNADEKSKAGKYLKKAMLPKHNPFDHIRNLIIKEHNYHTVISLLQQGKVNEINLRDIDTAASRKLVLFIVEHSLEKNVTPDLFKYIVDHIQVYFIDYALGNNQEKARANQKTVVFPYMVALAKIYFNLKESIYHDTIEYEISSGGFCEYQKKIITSEHLHLNDKAPLQQNSKIKTEIDTIYDNKNSNFKELMQMLAPEKQQTQNNKLKKKKRVIIQPLDLEHNLILETEIEKKKPEDQLLVDEKDLDNEQNPELNNALEKPEIELRFEKNPQKSKIPEIKKPKVEIKESIPTILPEQPKIEPILEKTVAEEKTATIKQEANPIIIEKEQAEEIRIIIDETQKQNQVVQIKSQDNVGVQIIEKEIELEIDDNFEDYQSKISAYDKSNEKSKSIHYEDSDDFGCVNPPYSEITDSENNGPSRNNPTVQGYSPYTNCSNEDEKYLTIKIPHNYKRSRPIIKNPVVDNKSNLFLRVLTILKIIIVNILSFGCVSAFHKATRIEEDRLKTIQNQSNNNLPTKTNKTGTSTNKILSDMPPLINEPKKQENLPQTDKRVSKDAKIEQEQEKEIWRPRTEAWTNTM